MSSRYEIRIQGQLSARWHRVFEPLALVAFDGGQTVLRGELPDQPALHGILRLLEHNGLTLIALRSLDEGPSSAP